MIKSFKCKETEKVWNEIFSRKLPADIQRRAFNKLLLIDAATDISDLSTNKGNCFEALKGNRQGQYSIRINDQWRMCFNWLDNQAFNVEIVDYH